MGAEPTAGIVIIGDEILSGQFADENAAFLIPRLRELGVSLRRIAVIPDELDDIAETVGAFSRRFDFVVTSGGIGPTHDDLTIAGVARAFGRSVVQEPMLVELLKRYFGGRLQTGHMRLADVPEGAELVYGADPNAPVVAMNNVYILPGVPSFFRSRFDAIAERFRASPFVQAMIYTTSDEADVARDLGRIALAHPELALGSYPRFEETTYRVMITIKGKDSTAVAAATSSLVSLLGDRVVRVERS